MKQLRMKLGGAGMLIFALAAPLAADSAPPRTAAQSEHPIAARTAVPANDHVVVSPTVLEPLDVHKRTSATIVDQLRHAHYLRKDIDDALSSEVFDLSLIHI